MCVSLVVGLFAVVVVVCFFQKGRLILLWYCMECVLLIYFARFVCAMLAAGSLQATFTINSIYRL